MELTVLRLPVWVWLWSAYTLAAMLGGFCFKWCVSTAAGQCLEVRVQI